jgi:polyhydroxybutyrate depolymerase
VKTSHIRYIMLVLFCLPIAGTAQQQYTFEHDGVTRSYFLYTPDSLPTNAALVFVLHGFGGSGDKIMDYSRMNLVADSHKFMVCYPNGAKTANGTPHWNARLTYTTTDDVGFLSELARELQLQYSLNPGHTFACGHSNGGFMSYTLACEAPEVFKAIASMAGTMSGYTWNNCNPSEPIPVLQIHGLADNTVPIDGSITTSGGWGGGPHVDEVVQYWADLNNCISQDSTFLPENTYAYYHRRGVDNHQVWYYKLRNWGHGWPSSVVGNRTGTYASEVIWEFFSTMITNSTAVELSLDVAGYQLYANYPNPALVATRIGYSIPKEDRVIVRVYDVFGRIVRTLVDERQGAGSYSVQLDGNTMPEGIYFYTLETGEVVLTKKMVLAN